MPRSLYHRDIHGQLINKAKKRIAKLNLKNIIFQLGDGAEGWKNKALFDAIIISAAMQESIPNQKVSEIIPAKLLENLKTPGRAFSYAKKKSIRKSKTAIGKKK